MTMKKLIFIIGLWLIILPTFAADLKSLKQLFQDNFNSYYEPRFCGRNIQRLLINAKERNIDLTNAYVLKVVGGGFLETSGFYTRTDPNERAMLGYFHMVLVADGYVFDFDLNESLVLKLEDYIRLQFTPPYEPYVIWGITYIAQKELAYWKTTRFEWKDYVSNKHTATWEKSMKDYVSLEEVMSRKRIR